MGTPAISVSAYRGWNDRSVEPSVIVKVHSMPKGMYVYLPAGRKGAPSGL